MAATESKTVFSAKLVELGLDDLQSKFDDNGWSCFADFGAACSDMRGADPVAFQGRSCSRWSARRRPESHGSGGCS